MDIRIGLVGYGTVNQGFVQLMIKHNQSCSNTKFVVVGVSDLRMGFAGSAAGLDLEGLSALSVEDGALAELENGSSISSNESLLDEELGAQIIAEATFTNSTDGQPSLNLCQQAIDRGIHVVTTNKGPIAFGYSDLCERSRRHGVQIGLEGTVMSGTPILRWARTCFPGEKLTAARGILNGTSNYILSEVESGRTFEDALLEAQQLGYAEADPSSDLEGHDVRLKVAILAKLVFGADIRPIDIPTEGIIGLTEDDVQHALAKNEHWKLIGQVERINGRVEAKVGPALLPASDPLSKITGNPNALELETSLLGPVMMTGPGAGRAETAYAMYADTLSIAQYRCDVN